MIEELAVGYVLIDGHKINLVDIQTFKLDFRHLQLKESKVSSYLLLMEQR